MPSSYPALNIASAKHTVVISWYTSMANPSFPSDSFSGFYVYRGYQFLWGGLTAYLLWQRYIYFTKLYQPNAIKTCKMFPIFLLLYYSHTCIRRRHLIFFTYIRLGRAICMYSESFHLYISEAFFTLSLNYSSVKHSYIKILPNT